MSTLQAHLPNAAADLRGTPEEKIALLRSLAIDCGVSLSNEAVSSEGLYD